MPGSRTDDVILLDTQSNIALTKTFAYRVDEAEIAGLYSLGIQNIFVGFSVSVHVGFLRTLHDVELDIF